MCTEQLYRDGLTVHEFSEGNIAADGLFIKTFMKDLNPRGQGFQGIVPQLNGPQQRIINVLSLLQYFWDQMTSGIFLLAGLQRIVHAITAILHSTLKILTLQVQNYLKRTFC
jgi:hypothetical protein